VFGGWPMAAQPQLDIAEGVQRAGYATTVAGLPEQGQGMLVIVGGRLVAAQPFLDDAEICQRAGFAGPVACLPAQV